MSVNSKVKSGILLLAFIPILAMIGAWQQQNFGGAIASVFGRSGTITAATGDYTVGQVTAADPVLGVTVSPNCPASNAGSCYFAKFDVTTVSDGTTTSGSNIVTSPTAKFQTGTHPAVVGQAFFANDSTSSKPGANTCLDNPDITFGSNRSTTILSVDSDTQIHVTGNASATSTAKACMAWGDDDTTALNAAWAAGGCNASLIMASGKAFFSAPVFQAIAGCPAVSNSGNGYQGQRVWGNSVVGTYLIPLPVAGLFTGVAGNGGPTCTPSACQGVVGNPNIADYENFNVWGLGQRCSTEANTTLFLVGVSTRAINTNGIGFCGEGGGATLIGYNITGGTDIYNWGGSNFFGCIEMNFEGPGYIWFGNSYISGVTSSQPVSCGVSGVVIQDATTVTSITNSLHVALQVGVTAGATGATWNSVMTQMGGNLNDAANPDTSCVFVGQNSTINMLSADTNCSGPGTNETAISFFGTSGGGIVNSSNSSHFANGTANVITGAASNTFNDLTGNKFSGGAGFWNGTGTWLADSHSVKASCTGTATSSSTLGLYGTGPNETLTTCTSTTIGNGVAMNGARTVQNFTVTATHAGFSASSGVFTVLKNGVGTTITCTVGTGTSCKDQTHSVAFADGDLLSIQFTTQATEVLAGVKALVMWY